MPEGQVTDTVCIPQQNNILDIYMLQPAKHSLLIVPNMWLYCDNAKYDTVLLLTASIMKTFLSHFYSNAFGR